MHYIEENFVNYETHLPDLELEVLKQFIEKLKNNLLVEGAYILPIHYPLDSRHDEQEIVKINIKIIINDTPEYNLMTYKKELPNREFNLKRIESIIDEFNFGMNMIKNKLNEYEINYYLGESIDYTIEPSSTFQELANEELFNSYVIFDRYGYYSNLQERLKNTFFYPCVSLTKINNIEALDKNYVKRK